VVGEVTCFGRLGLSSLGVMGGVATSAGARVGTSLGGGGVRAGSGGAAATAAGAASFAATGAVCVKAEEADDDANAASHSSGTVTTASAIRDSPAERRSCRSLGQGADLLQASMGGSRTWRRQRRRRRYGGSILQRCEGVLHRPQRRPSLFAVCKAGCVVRGRAPTRRLYTAGAALAAFITFLAACPRPSCAAPVADNFRVPSMRSATSAIDFSVHRGGRGGLEQQR